jgi:hypothetical protein
VLLLLALWVLLLLLCLELWLLSRLLASWCLVFGFVQFNQLHFAVYGPLDACS